VGKNAISDERARKTETRVDEVDKGSAQYMGGDDGECYRRTEGRKRKGDRGRDRVQGYGENTPGEGEGERGVGTGS
jgi:hypothetical protein